MAKRSREEIAADLGEGVDTVNSWISRGTLKRYVPKIRRPKITRLMEHAAANAGIKAEKLWKWLCDQLNE